MAPPAVSSHWSIRWLALWPISAPSWSEFALRLDPPLRVLLESLLLHQQEESLWIFRAAWSLTLCHRVRRLYCWILLLLHRGLVLCQKREPSTPLIPTTVATKIKSWTVPATQHDVPVWSKLVTKFPQWNHAIRITGIGLLLLPARCSCLGRVGLKGNKVLLELTLCCLPVECKQSYSRHQVNTKLTFNNVVINTYIYIYE